MAFAARPPSPAAGFPPPTYVAPVTPARPPTALVVGVLGVGVVAAGTSALITREAYDIAGGGTTALGLASFWGTGAVTEVPEVKRLVGLEPEDEIVAVVYLGWPVEAAPSSFRESAPVINVTLPSSKGSPRTPVRYADACRRCTGARRAVRSAR